jgi:hypothetical protein
VKWPDDTEWCAAVSFVPIGAWRRIKDRPDDLSRYMSAMTAMLARELPQGDGWHPDTQAHHGVELDEPGHGRGVRVVLRAWRWKT